MRLSTLYAPNGMVASVDHLASSAGVAVLRAGGTAADAAVAASAVLAVTAPHLCGMGGDLFALVHEPGTSAPSALNASGRAGSGADPDRLRDEGHTRMPFRDDIRSAPVPGCVDGWLALHSRFGRRSLRTVLEAAVTYAAKGFPASPLLAATLPLLGQPPGSNDLTRGRLRPGDIVRRPGVAGALRSIVADGRAGFYDGDFGLGLLTVGQGEYLRKDLEHPLADWVEPLGVRVWGHDVWTIPPNSQGYLSLLSAAVAEGLTLPGDTNDRLWPHLLVEAARVAAFDRLAVLHEYADVRPLLDASEVGRRRALINPDRRVALTSSPSGTGDTMYLCAVDADRMGVSLIQSNASGFGSHVFEPATGIGLHNRGVGFSLEPGHPAEYGPGRRPPHTLAPALVTAPGGTLRAVLGSMGGDAQPQIVLQLLTRLLCHGESPGSAVGAPRWALTQPGGTGFDTWEDADAVHVALEETAPDVWITGLADRGHRCDRIDGITGAFGHAHVIQVTPENTLAGAADPRALISAATGY